MLLTLIFIFRNGIIVPSGWKEVALRWKNSKAKFLFRERIFLFRDRTVVKTERSEVLAVQIEEKENSLEEKKEPESFSISEHNLFSATRMHFFLLWSLDLQKENLILNPSIKVS